MMPKSHRASAGQRGYILLALLMFVTVLAITAAAVAPRLAHQIRRQREEELIHRGREYVKAIRKYYRRFGSYPLNLEQLEKANNMRFLRKRYKDPITGEDFRLIRMGESATLAAAPQLPAGQQGSAIGTPAGALASPQQGRSLGTPASSLSRPMGSGQSFGGGPIVGVASTSERQSIRELNKKTHYNEWEFVYDPRLEMALPGAVGQPGQPGRPGQPGQPGQQPQIGPGPTSPAQPPPK